MSNIDWSKLRKAADIKAEAELARLAPLIAEETQWVESERNYVAEQLEAIEDGEETPGTECEWRDYRIQVRAWKQGAEGFPDSDKRPARPS
ncbi:MULTISPECIES: hypothetical protein [unclassified Pseudomonas]|uniref:hypothetical protein n=1 Tax=unclassified Pseudomonas TaxID=196821 RepID=UPI0014737421|nr:MULTISPECIES: hypothetical protein [unclassified Pseudomonas]NMY37117.1 hypothetical protein [Pseudomonas sp. WS 5078]NMY59567.1 hypothetical protein [Pseudomonas sp. WS 5354]